MKSTKINKLIKCIIPLELSLLIPFYNINTPFFYILSIINLTISSIFLHSSITWYNYNYNSKLIQLFYTYDKFSIMLVCSYFISDYKYLSIIFSLYFQKYENIKNSIYVATIIYNLFNNRWFLTIFAMLALYSYKRRLQDNEWTLKNKIFWCSMNALYLLYGTEKYKK